MNIRRTVGLAAGWGPAAANSTVMEDETRLEQRLDRVVARAVSPRGAAVVIATVSTSITAGAGLLMTVADRENFPSIGSGLWWAVQTVTTVGYGDHVPATVAGRLVAALVMLVGIGFLTVITAAITSTFVARSRREQTPSAAITPTEEQLRQIAARLERIEAALTDRPSG
jgi:voltage-gated potassium channel Kch